MSQNLLQLWKANGEVFPFAAKRDKWAPGRYVVVEAVQIRKWPYGQAWGWTYVEGKLQPELGTDRTTGTPPEISGSGCYQWTMVDGIDGTKKETPTFKKKPLKVYTKGQVFSFGKHKGRAIEEVFAKDPDYIKWALENVAAFALDPQLIAELNPNDPEKRVGAKHRKLNWEKFEKGPPNV